MSRLSDLKTKPSHRGPDALEFDPSGCKLLRSNMLS